MAKTQVRFKPIRISGSSTVEKKRIRNQRGKSTVQFELDSTGPDFVRELLTVFSLNVVAARRANSGVSIKPFSSRLNKSYPKEPLLKKVLTEPTKKKKKKKKTASISTEICVAKT